MITDLLIFGAGAVVGAIIFTFIYRSNKAIFAPLAAKVDGKWDEVEGKIDVTIGKLKTEVEELKQDVRDLLDKLKDKV